MNADNRGVVIGVVGVIGSLLTAHAQWLTQEIDLRAGWNAVFLEVQPEPADCPTVLADVDIESVWAWNRRFTTAEFIENPAELLPQAPDWLVYLPDLPELAVQNRLYAMDGGRGYLIKMPEGSAPVSWRIQGRAVVRPIAWVPDSFNFVGFQASASTPPTLQVFFGPSAAHMDQPVLRLGTDGFWRQVTSPQTERLRAGEAVWVRCQGISDYQGSIQVTLEQVDRMDFGRSLLEHTVRFRNLGSAPKDVVVSLVASEVPWDPVEAADYAGSVMLSYQEYVQESRRLEWRDLPERLGISGLQPGEERIIRLALRRKEMHGEGVFQSLLKVATTSDDFRMVIPVTAEGGPGADGTSLSLHGKADNGSQSPRAGLWVGSAIIRKVNQPANTEAPDLPVETSGSEFQFRLLLHVDALGQARLLQHVVQMWKAGTYESLPGNPGLRRVVEPGRDVLITDDVLLENTEGLIGVTLIDGKPVGRRFSSACFGFRDPQPLSFDSGTSFGEDGTILAGVLTNDYRADPLNPFVHKYHPNHDSLDRNYQPTLGEGVESFTVVRTIHLEFSAEDEEWGDQPGWQDTLLGGVYREELQGLHRVNLQTEGKFLLRRAGWAPELNKID